MSASGIAIVGMAGRFPGARTVGEFWSRLLAGAESVRRIDGASPGLVPAVASMDGVDLFDAPFFGISPAVAEVMDPQHRVFFEVAWEALEDAGCDPSRCTDPIGVFAGATANTYFAFNLLSNPDTLTRFTPIELNVANANDFLTTRFSYFAGLHGPSHSVQCACSTSLVAVCLACQSILDGQCEMALAGGVSVNVTHLEGYRYIDGGMVSSRGHCRAFAASADGTVFGNGAGVVVLKSVDAALRDRDHIYSVIIGTAVNNDGRNKVGYLAPSVEGQARVIAEALANAAVPAATIGFVEAHGTGTPLGDPIEIRGLTKAFRASTDRRQFCSVGSVKSNVGHLDAAAGVTGLIKAALAVSHGVIPGTLEVEPSNPEIDFSDSPFYVHAAPRVWSSEGPRRAGVSASGVGGTNAHVILEQAPPVSPSGASSEWKLLTLSARSAESLGRACLNLAGWLRANEHIDLADVAYTLQTGRRRFRFRRAVLCRDGREAVRWLEDSRTTPFEAQSEDAPAVSFTFEPLDGGVSCTLEAMLASDLPSNEAVRACLGRDVVPEQVVDGAENRASAPVVVQYAAARCLMDWGVLPVAIAGAGTDERIGRALAEALLSDGAGGRVSKGPGEPSQLVAADDGAAPQGGIERLRVRFGGGGQSAEPNTITVDVAEIARKPAEALRRIVGRLWEAGVDIDWRKFDGGKIRKRVPLPTYAFEHKRYWIGRQLEAAATRARATEVPAPVAPRPPLAVPYVAPRSDVQRAIRDVWARVLGIRGIGIDDNFFDLGGDSLLAVSVAERITGELGISVPAAALYEGTSIRLLAELLEHEASTSDAAQSR